MFCATLLFLGMVNDATLLPKRMAVVEIPVTSNGDGMMMKITELGQGDV